MTPMHSIINNTLSGPLLLKDFPCAECLSKVRVNARHNTTYRKPVHHGMQHGKCSQCGAEHMIFNARTIDDCDALIPLVESVMSNHGSRIVVRGGLVSP